LCLLLLPIGLFILCLLIYAVLVIPTWSALAFIVLKKNLQWLPECKQKHFRNQGGDGAIVDLEMA